MKTVRLTNVKCQKCNEEAMRLTTEIKEEIHPFNKDIVEKSFWIAFCKECDTINSMFYSEQRHQKNTREKVCLKCKKLKLLTEFSQYKTSKDEVRYSTNCKKCKNDSQNEYRKKGYLKKYYNEYPWRKVYKRISSRCYWHKSSYYKRRIRVFISLGNIKYLWFRDQAYLMKRPSIDRKNNNGNYTLENCQFIELKKNKSKPRGKRIPYEIRQTKKEVK